jgi:hypothetical protein
MNMLLREKFKRISINPKPWQVYVGRSLQLLLFNFIKIGLLNFYVVFKKGKLRGLVLRKRCLSPLRWA